MERLPVSLGTNNLLFWKELQPYKHYVLTGSERRGRGVQILELRKLLTIDAVKAPVKFDELADLTIPCWAGFIFVDPKNPSNPQRNARNVDDGYVHDQQCLPYEGLTRSPVPGPRRLPWVKRGLVDHPRRHQQHPIDDISVALYDDVQHSHQGVVLNPGNQEPPLLVEIRPSGMAMVKASRTVHLGHSGIWSTPSKPVFAKAPSLLWITTAWYLTGNVLVYQSEYMAGYRVYGISSIPADPTWETRFAWRRPWTSTRRTTRRPAAAWLIGTAPGCRTRSSPRAFMFINTIERGGYLAKMTRRVVVQCHHFARQLCVLLPAHPVGIGRR
ncbi:hypothetical protein MAPG_11433 [Magnaporthiopsis poae ATCC 64411]|uniref:Uncharacterized protein n=1 Tax=Magnaporthiopsis poae (strain ATCC 64411 / 73-15) TaxID=644358 RepID=A0A0C4EF94_MAGP6|nr:hypothetical protein MAPG_11433 [Magnaporthiopsis poae ATCC 64411]